VLTSRSRETAGCRIVVVVGGLHAGGAERQLALLLKHAPKSLDAHVCTLDPGGSLDDAVAESATLHKIVGSHITRLRALSDVVGEVKPSVVLGWHFYTNAYAALVARRHGCRSVGGIRGSLEHEKSMQPKAWRANLWLPQQIAANSVCAQQECLRHRKSVLHVPNAVEPTPPKPAAEIGADQALRPRADGRPIVALVGNLRPEKRIDRFLEALAMAKARGRPWHGVLIGSGPLQAEVEAKIRELELDADDVRLLGHVSEPRHLIGAADLVAITSDSEGTSNALLEAMMAGVAVLTTDIGELGESLKNGVDAFVVNRDADAVATGLCAAHDRVLRTRVAEAGQRRVEADYSVARAIEAWTKVLRCPKP
jgi:glycosyltransferase involved in cell wall biosynthesis